MKKYDVIVVGLGALGSGILYELSVQSRESSVSTFFDKPSTSRHRMRVLGIDQYPLPHPFGSTHGEKRIFRLVNPQGSDYVNLGKRSFQICQQMEENYNVVLYEPTGGLMIGKSATPNSMLEKLKLSAEQNNILHKNLSSSDISSQYSKLNIKPSEEGYYESTWGIMLLEEYIKTRLNVAEQNGAEINIEQLISFRHEGEKIFVETNKAQYITDKLVLATGPWMPEVLNKYLPDVTMLSVHRAIVCSFKVEKNERDNYKIGTFPITMWDVGEGNMVIVFPMAHDHDCVTVMYFPGGAAGAQKVTPNTVNRIVSAAEQEEIYLNYIAPCFKGINKTCVQAYTCLYTFTKDRRFAIDFLPGYGESVITVSACSRQGFQYSSAVAESIAERILTNENQNTIDVFEKFSSGLFSPIVNNPQNESAASKP